MTIINESYLNTFIDISLQEDSGDGDHTSLACIPAESEGMANLIIKQDGILAGMETAEKIFERTDKNLEMIPYLEDGRQIKAGNIAFLVKGKTQSILKAERLVLNVMQRMSGIATQTHNYVKAIEGLNAVILDTRKTTPGMRLLEKAAVKAGGGENHRMGLYDMIMIKDNHKYYAGGIEKAIKAVKKYLTDKKKTLKIEVEAHSLEEVKEIMNIGGIDMILLDNFSINETREAVKIISGRCKTESSGGITMDTVREYAECGVDYISVGALTHQIKSLDMSLKAI